MEFYPKSLRQKLVRGYVSAVAIIAGFVVLSWSNLNSLEHMVVAWDTVTDLFDTTLEIRRFEKNYFLYETEEDFEELLGYVSRAEELLQKKELSLFTSPAVIDELRESVAYYKGMLSESPAGRGTTWESHLREKGHAIVTVAEKIS